MRHDSPLRRLPLTAAPLLAALLVTGSVASLLAALLVTASVASLLAALLVTASVASAQPVPAHGQPRPLRPIHTRIGLADATALVTIEAVDSGRLHVRDAQSLIGSVAAQFEIKRSPSRPPPLEAGDHALVSLRGARSPYLLLDEPREVIELAGFDHWPRWREAIANLREIGELPEGRDRSLP